MSYFGSVRFFKNLILLGVVVSIVVPTGLAVHWGRQIGGLQTELDAAAAAPRDSVMQPGKTLPESSVPPADSLLSPDAPDYQALYPDFYAPEPLSADRHSDKTMFLTFDDGPSDRTDEILDILEKQSVKATFFVIGRTDEVSLQRMRNIVNAGHSLGMHSYSHDYKTIYASVENFLADQYRLFTLIRDTTGVTPSVFRFPGGSINAYNHGIYQEILSEMLRRGFVPCDWNLSSGDATGSATTPAKICSNVLDGAKNVNRGFVLMHDAAPKATTVAALNNMITGLRELGFSFEPFTAEIKPVLFGYIE
ncbi:MAG: polysaccharide deacetylase family protein [Oscillibacter sp.]